ncbi:MerR family transcriptional regulator [Lysobacter tyrosinilyticus]
MKRQPHLTVSQVAALTHLTVRALHHYDAIGLLKPSQRSAAGYRLYDDDDLRRLRQVLLFRELGFGLDAVHALIDATPDRQRQALLEQRAVVDQQRRHAEAVLRAVDATLDSLQEQRPMTTDKLFEGFEQFENGEYAREAEQRWGHTEAWQESRRRVAGYKRADWQAAQSEHDALIADLRSARDGGAAPDSERAMALAERHRLHIGERYYPCSNAMQCGLADLYETDERFRDYYDRHGAGLAAYLIAAIRANAAEQH